MTTSHPEVTKRKILIDCDTGTDDAIAIVAALYSQDMDLVALTTVDGNVALKYTALNTLNLVHYLDFNVPVAVGAASQLKHHVIHRPSGTHGNEGLGSVSLPDMQAKFYEKNAIETIYDEAKKAQGELDIVAIGPLTNLALAFMMYPELSTMIRHIYVMGGAAWGGNVSTTAEFNIWKDPEAARLVFASGIPCTMVGLDVTEKAILDEKDAEKCRALHTKAGDFVADILDFMFVRRDAGGEDALMHDALALAAVLKPECLEVQKYFVDVECEGTYTFGHTYVDLRNRLKREPNVYVAMGLHLDLFKEWLHDCLANSK